jgi:hypothetical protein
VPSETSGIEDAEKQHHIENLHTKPNVENATKEEKPSNLDEATKENDKAENIKDSKEHTPEKGMGDRSPEDDVKGMETMPDKTEARSKSSKELDIELLKLITEKVSKSIKNSEKREENLEYMEKYDEKLFNTEAALAAENPGIFWNVKPENSIHNGKSSGNLNNQHKTGGFTEKQNNSVKNKEFHDLHILVRSTKL